MGEAKWAGMWESQGRCAGFSAPSDYFGFAVAAAKKYDADVSCCLLWRGFDAWLLAGWWPPAFQCDACYDRRPPNALTPCDCLLAPLC